MIKPVRSDEEGDEVVEKGGAFLAVYLQYLINCANLLRDDPFDLVCSKLPVFIELHLHYMLF